MSTTVIDQLKEEAATQLADVQLAIENESMLNDWERKFIDSLSVQLANMRQLSEKQVAKLAAIASDIRDRREDDLFDSLRS